MSDDIRVRAQLKLAKDGGYALRSCWNCNEAHEHLKTVDYVIACLRCGKWYFEGIDITEDDDAQTPQE